MRNLGVLLLSLCAFIFFGPVESAAFRCGDGLVSVGDMKTKVRLECGEPSFKNKDGLKKMDRKRATGHKTEPSGKKIEKWYYNCGDNDFIYILTFEGNTLVKEESNGYGRGKSDCDGKKR